MSELTPIDAGQVVNIPLNQIEPDPEQPRRAKDPAFLEQLAADIKARGVQQPITIRKPSYDGESYIIKYGEQRFEASRLAGKRTIPCVLAGPEVLRNKESNRNLERLFDQVHENHDRQDLNALDYAYTCRRMREEFGLTVKQIADEFAERGFKSMSRPHISNLMRLADLPQWVQDAIRNNRISAGHGKILFTALHSPAVEEAIKEIIESQADDPPSVRELEAQIRECYGDHHRPAYELGWPPNQGLFDDLPAAGVVEALGDRWVVDMPKYQAALMEAKERHKAAQQASNSGKGDGATDEEDDDLDAGEGDDESAGDDDIDETDKSLNPMWDSKGEVWQGDRNRLVIASVRRCVVDKLLSGPLDHEALCGIGAWRAYDLGKLQDNEWADRDDEMLFETASQFDEALKEIAPDLREGGVRAWAGLSKHRYFDVMAKAGRLVVECSSDELIAELATAYNITLADYRVDENYLRSLDREPFTALLNAGYFEGEAGITAATFDEQVAALLEVSWRFGTPESIQQMWDHIMAKEGDANE